MKNRKFKIIRSNQLKKYISKMVMEQTLAYDKYDEEFGEDETRGYVKRKYVNHDPEVLELILQGRSLANFLMGLWKYEDKFSFEKRTPWRTYDFLNLVRGGEYGKRHESRANKFFKIMDELKSLYEKLALENEDVYVGDSLFYDYIEDDDGNNEEYGYLYYIVLLTEGLPEY